MIKHLLYHATAIHRPLFWYNMKLLKAGLSQFNGKKIITVAIPKNDDVSRSLLQLTDEELVSIESTSRDTAALMQTYLDDPDIEYIEVENSHNTEAPHFYDQKIPRIISTSADEITFYGHTKGIRWPESTPSYLALISWIYSLYFHVYTAPTIDATLRDHACVGAIKAEGIDFDWLGVHNINWHYSGAFFWFRHDAIFTTDWHCQDDNRFRVEYFLPRIIPSSHAATTLPLPLEFTKTNQLMDTARWQSYWQRHGFSSWDDVLAHVQYSI